MKEWADIDNNQKITYINPSNGKLTERESFSETMVCGKLVKRASPMARKEHNWKKDDKRSVQLNGEKPMKPFLRFSMTSVF
jgi:hypothetical protein